MRKLKRFVAMMLCIAMCSSMIPTTVFAKNVDETVEMNELVCLDHDHDYGKEVAPAFSAEGYSGEFEKTETETPTPDSTEEMFSFAATCSHSYTYTYAAAGHTQHTKNGTCSKCGATTSAKENHTWSGKQCSLCGCYKPITANGVYDVIGANGIQMYAQNNSASTKLDVVPKGTSITVTNVAATSSGYYWGKVTRIGTKTQSATAWVCMKSSELESHSHNYSYAYSVTNHSQHTKTGTCGKCGATTSAKENHSWSGLRCSFCGCYKPLTSDGIYDVIGANGIQMYAQNNSASTKLDVVPKGTSITVTNVAATSAGYYWGKVTKVGTKTQSTTAWVCMKSSDLQTHTHSWNTTYSTHRDAWHTEQSTCSKCGTVKSAENKAHTFENGVCKHCNHPQVSSAVGGYVTFRDSEALRVDTYESADSPKQVPKGTFIEISQVITNSYGNYWGKVSSIDGKAVTSTMYAYMGSLTSHGTHSVKTKAANVNNIEHDVTESCSVCSYTKTVRQQHSFSDGICTLCNGWQAYSEDGDYIIINEDGVKIYSQPISSGTSQELDTLKKGVFVQISDVKLNAANNYWGKIEKIGNKTPDKTMYIYMGSGQLRPHNHNWNTVYSAHRDAWHTEQSTCSECGYVNSAENKAHTFQNGACKYCNHPQVFSTPGSYVPYRASEPLREQPSQDSAALDQAEKGNYLEIIAVEENRYGNYWGVVTIVGNRKLNKPLYVYMGNVTAHNHSLSAPTYPGSNNIVHKKISTCICGYVGTEMENHSFVNSKCELCGALEAYRQDGSYLIINESGVWTYTKPITSGDSEQVMLLEKNCFLEVVDVSLNSADNYWGRVIRTDGKAVTGQMYIYMGRGQIEPHTHSESATYKSKSDTQHYKSQSCQGCGVSYVEAAVEDHVFEDKVCIFCGKEEVAHTDGLYVTVRTLETLRLDTYEDSAKAEKLPTGTCLEIVDIATNKYGNWWGVVKSIDGVPPAKSPTYAYLGNLKPHAGGEHTWDATYAGVNNISHDLTEACIGCNMVKTERLPHHFENGACTACTAWQAYETDGTYITIKDDVPVYSKNITSLSDSRVLDTLTKNTFLLVEDVELNSAGNYWGRVKRIGNEAVSVEMYIYMGRGQLQSHDTHTMTGIYSTKSDTQHYANTACEICGYTDNTAVVEDHVFDQTGVCARCNVAEVAHTGELYVTVRESETLRADRYADSTDMGNYPKGTVLTVTDVQVNSYGNWWARVVQINGEAAPKTCYTYLGNLKPHAGNQHDWTLGYQSVNNVSHDAVAVCSGCSMKTVVRQDHTFIDHVCTVCGAWEAYSEKQGSYITIKEGVKLYSVNHSDESKGSKVIKTLTAGTYIQVENVKRNSADNYWGKVTRIGNYAEKQAVYVYMGRGQLQFHGDNDHSYSATYESVNNLKHKADKVCTICSYTTTVEESHRFGTDAHNACTDCGAWKANTENGMYITINEDVILYSKRSSDTKNGSKVLKTLPKGTFLGILDVQTNSAGNWWGKVTVIDNDVTGKTAMYVYMGSGSLAPHTHEAEYTLISTSDTQHNYGYRCLTCKCYQTDITEDHIFENGLCTVCHLEEVCHERGSYVTVRTAEPLKAGTYSDSKEVDRVAAGTLLEVSEIIINKFGNYWGKVSKINGESAGKKTMYTYLGNLEYHPVHTLSPCWESQSDDLHNIGEKCEKCYYINFTSAEDHDFDNSGVCRQCGKTDVPTESGNYVTVRASESLYASASKDAKVLQSVPAGTRLMISDVKKNSYNNWWGKVTQIDGTAQKKVMYVYMGGVLRHETHDLQPFCDQNSDTRHTSGLRCTGCNLTQDVAQSSHNMNGSICLNCGATEVFHEAGGYLVRIAGNLKKSRSRDAGNVQVVKEGSYLEVTDIAENSSGNWWGKVAAVDGKKPKQTAYVYLGNLTPHTHDKNNLVVVYAQKDLKKHTVTITCTECAYYLQQDSVHAVSADGKCTQCQTEIPVSTAKGDYVTFKKVTLYQDKKLTKPAGITVNEGYLLKITAVNEIKGENRVSGKLSQYGQTKTGLASLYVDMAQITPHTTHSYTEEYWSKCDAYHYQSYACSVTGCTATKKGREEAHTPTGKTCTVCQKAPVPTGDGVYLVRSGSDVALYSNRNSSGSSAVSAAAGSIIVVEDVQMNPATGNYWGKVSWYNGQKPSKTVYVYMGSLVTYTPSASVTVSGSDSTYHYFRDGDEVFPAKHKYQNGVCEGCGLAQSTAVAGIYIAKANCSIYSRSTQPRTKQYIMRNTGKSYSTGAVLKVKSIERINGAWYGSVDKNYVLLSNVTYHGKHTADSENWVKLNDKQHTYDVNCPVCGISKKVKENHVFNDQHVCIFCGEAESISAQFYIVVKRINVYKSNGENSAVLETLPKGSILKVGTIKEKNGLYWGSGIQVVEDGTLTACSGYIRMSRNWLAEHTHNWSAEKLASATETEHSMVKTCTDCDMTETNYVAHRNLACKTCGAKSVSIGFYTVKDQVATAYKDTSGKSKYADLREGDFVRISKIESQNGIYWGKIFQIGEKELKDDAYIAMHSLTTHAHKFNYVLTGRKDNYHVYKGTCTLCNLTEEQFETHNFNLGQCTVCGNTVVPASTGAYVATRELTLHKKPSSGSAKVSKNASVSKGTHLFIQEIKIENSMVQTKADGSIYGGIVWGRVSMAGSKKYGTQAWVQMSGLQEDYLNTEVSYRQVNTKQHTASYNCTDCSCGLKGNTTMKHAFDSTNTCTECDLNVFKPDTYYTTRSNVKYYSSDQLTLGHEEYQGIIYPAGSELEVKQVSLFNGKVYCYTSWLGSTVYVAQEDLTDHVHSAAGLYTVLDDEYHQLSKWEGTVCRICGVDIPEINTNLAKSRHTDGSYCKVCHMPEIPKDPGTYYAPYDGYYAYTSRTQHTSIAKPYYQAGDKIEISKTSTVNGIIWGQVKGTTNYVPMKTLSTTPIKSENTEIVLTDQEIIDWCVNFQGTTPFYSYGYHSRMLETVGAGDILLMSINSRAGSAVDLVNQVLGWFKVSYGDTMAKVYYEGQVIALLTALEEEADYSASIPHKKAIQDAIKAARLQNDWHLTYQGEAELSKSDIDALEKLNKNLKSTAKILDYSEVGLELYTYLVMDFSRMQGIMQAARAIQSETISDPVLYSAFEEVIKQYENQYYKIGDQILKLALKEFEENFWKWTGKKPEQAAGEMLAQITGFDIGKDFGFVYNVVKFGLDFVMKVSSGATYAKSTMKFMQQISIVLATGNAYNTAVQNIQDGDHSAAAVAAVRRQFAAYKASMVELYDIMFTMATEHMFNIAEDEMVIAYLQSEKHKLESIYLTNDFSQMVYGISLEEYKRTH